MENFLGLNLSPGIAQAITELGFDKPTPIQAQALPLLLEGETDFLGMAATGTGKTAAFGIPLLQRIQPEAKSLQAVVLCPTRELAIQTARQLSQIAKYLHFDVPAIYGGGRFWEQRDALRSAPIIVATPGRLIDHMEQGNVSLQTLKTLVLDEADEMISMGFAEALDTILGAVSHETCRTWMFSATLPKHLQHVAEDFMKNPKRVHLNSKQVLSGTVQQVYYTVRAQNKARGLCKVIDYADDFYGLIFVQTKIEAQELTQFLRSRRYHVDSLHGDKEQAHRERTLAAFRTRQVNILVCTDVAARGLDVSDLTHVVNFSLPNDVESYVHRIGRTGRGGKQGIAMSLVEPRQMYLIPRIERRTKVQLEHGIFPSKKAVSARMLHRFLPQFAEVPNSEKALEILDEAWKSTLAGMTNEEIASRFLALALPDLFEDDEMSDERPAKKKAHAPERKFEKKPEKKFEKKSEKPANPKKRTYAHELPPPTEAPAAEAPVEVAPVAAAPESIVEPESVVESLPVVNIEELPTEMPTVEESGLYLEATTPVEPPPVEPSESLVPGEEIEAAVETPVPPSLELEAAIEAAVEEGEEAEAQAAQESEERPHFQKKPFDKKPFGKKPFGKKPFGEHRDFGDRGPRRDFGDRPRRDFGERGGFGGPRREFGDRGGFGGPRREFGDRGGFGGPRREFGDRGGFGGPRREFGDRGPRRDFGDGGGFGGPRRDFGDRGGFGGPRREFGDRGPRRDFGDRGGFGKKPFGGPRRERPQFGEGRPFAPRPRGFMMDGEEVFLDRKPIERKQGGGKPYARKVKEDSVIPDVEREARDYAQNRETRGFGEKPFGKKPFGKSFGGGGGRKPFGGGGKSFGKRPFGGGGGKSFGRKPFGKPRHHDSHE